MTVQTSTNVATGIGNGVTTVFPVGYKFNDDSDLVVLRIDDATSAAETLTLNSDYTVQGAGNEAGGSVTMAAPLAVGKTLTITRIVDILQLTDLRNQGKFFAEVHEDSFDKFIMIMQQLFQAVGDSLQLNAARNRWDAKGRRIINVGDPVDAQDAVTKSWLEAYIAALLQTSIGPVQTAASVIIVAPNGDFFTLQDLANSTDPAKGAAIVGRSGQVVGSVAALRALSKAQPSKHAFVTGYYSDGDGGGGAYYLDAADTASADNGGTIIVATDGGRWKLVHNGTVSVKQFGAKGNDTDDDSAAVLAAVEAAGVSAVYFPKATYAVATSGTIVIRDAVGKRLYGDGAVLSKKGTRGVFYFIESSGIEIHGLEFNGNVIADEAAAGSILSGTRLSSDYAYAVVFEECSRCHVHDCYVHDFAWDGLVAYGIVAADGLSATYSSEIRFTDNRLHNVRGSMIWNKAVKNLWIEGNYGFNDDGSSPFEQKANFIFCVEFCENVVIDNNQALFIGDNAVGIGDQINDTPQAKNRRLTITNNQFRTTRYHAILIAQAENGVISGNIIERAGAKDEMFPSSSVLCSAITLISGTDGGRSSQPNNRITVSNNVIVDPYEIGIYAFDRADTLLVDGSTDIVFENNIIRNAGQLPLATRIAVYGMYIQYPRPQVIRGNRISNIAGEGIRMFGDGQIKDNTIRAATRGINVPSDTIHGNVELSFPIEGNLCSGMTRSGITVTGRKTPVFNNNTCEECGIDIAPGTENVSTAVDYAGIGVYLADQVFLQGNRLNRNGSSGFVFRPGTTTKNRINAVNNYATDNGATFTTANLRSGFYAEGDGTTNLDATFLNTGGLPGANQQYPIRLLFGGGSVSVDQKFDTHPFATLGAAVKDMSNIP